MAEDGAPIGFVDVFCGVVFTGAGFLFLDASMSWVHNGDVKYKSLIQRGCVKIEMIHTLTLGAVTISHSYCLKN